MVHVPPAASPRLQRAPSPLPLTRAATAQTPFSLKRPQVGEPHGPHSPRHAQGAPRSAARHEAFGTDASAGGTSAQVAPLPRHQRGAEPDLEAGPPAGSRSRDHAGDGDHGEPDLAPPDDLACLDPLSRSLWSMVPPEHRTFDQAVAAASALTPAPHTAVAALDEILAKMVTRFALSGDKRRGTSHLVVGAGELAGGSVTLEAEGRAVHVRIDAPPGVDARAFGESIRTRLEARGLEPTIELR